MHKLRKIRVTGQVQGVFFRVNAREQAEKLGLTGLARNEPDGSVYIEIEGEPDKLDTFERWCHEGSPHARVEHVASSDDAPRGHKTFEAK